MGGKIFINYRRDDSAAHAISIAQFLESKFGKRNVFIDIDRLLAGQSFPAVLQSRLKESHIFLAIIGPSWLDLRDNSGNRRIDDPADWVRLEIATALSLGIALVPILVGGASIPEKQSLPPDLQGMIDRQAISITTNGFRNEMAGLARDLRAHHRSTPWWTIAIGVLVVLFGIIWLGIYNADVSWPSWLLSSAKEVTLIGATSRDSAPPPPPPPAEHPTTLRIGAPSCALRQWSGNGSGGGTIVIHSRQCLRTGLCSSYTMRAATCTIVLTSNPEHRFGGSAIQALGTHI